MYLGQRQVQSPELRHLTTAHLAQTMTLLGMSMLELRQKIEAELAENPALEITEERFCPNCHRKLIGSEPCPICSKPRTIKDDEPIVYLSDRQDFYTSYSISEVSSELPDDNAIPLIEDLPTYVLRQVAPDLATEERKIAAHILTSLDEDGLLPISITEIAQYHHVPVSKITSVLHLIQHADPIGVAASSPQEALLIQLAAIAETRPVPPLADVIIRNEMENLGRRQYDEIASKLKVSPHEVVETAQFISNNLNPFPARTHWGDIHYGASNPNTIAIQPDAIITLLDEHDPNSPLVVEILMPFRGNLQINSLFRQAIDQVSSDNVEDWKSYIDHANLLIKCLQQRYHTMRRLMYLLAKKQRNFILYGDAYLIPTTRASLAKELNVHESTISRAVSGKSVQVPNGQLIPLSRFFDPSLNIRVAVRQIISEEPYPLSDTQIMRQLKKQGFDVARRTVAKYRAMEGILPARLRQTHHPNMRL